MRRFLQTLLYSITLIAISTSVEVKAQFYQGSWQNFGQNRIQYDRFEWNEISYYGFTVYFYGNGRNLGEYATHEVYQNVLKLQKSFDYRYSDKFHVMVFNSLDDFRQCNIGLGTGQSNNIGGQANLQGNKLFVYFDGNHEHLRNQIREGMTRIIVNNLVYGDTWVENLKSNTLMVLPSWYIDGLVSYAGNRWNEFIDDELRDAVVHRRFRKFNSLSNDEAKFVGHAMWNYVAEVYGSNVIPNILYMARVSKSVDNGFLYVLGVPFEKLITDAAEYYRKKYEIEESNGTMPATEVKFKSKKKLLYQRPIIHPDGEKLAYVTNIMGKYRVYIMDIKTGKRTKVMTKEFKLDRIVDKSTPVIQWHPLGTMLGMIYKDKGQIYYATYDLETKEWDKRYVGRVEKVVDFAYAPSGTQIVMSVIRKGQSDVVLMRLKNNTQTLITDDVYDDLHPRFTDDGNSVIFTSNRDTVGLSREKDYKKITNTYDVYVAAYPFKGTELIRLTNTPNINEYMPFHIKENKFTFLSDESGILNRYVAERDSVIMSIDTAITYRYFNKITPVSNYRRSIRYQDLNWQAGTITNLMIDNDRYRIYLEPIADLGKSQVVQKTGFKTQEEEQQINNLESLPNGIQEISVVSIPIEDTVSGRINIDDYQFSGEVAQPVTDVVQPKKNANLVVIDSPNKSTETVKKDSVIIPRPSQYFESFSLTEVTTQLNLDYITNMYQRYNGGPFTPSGLSGVLKVSTEELFEDIIFEGAVRLGFSFSDYDVYMAFSNRKHKRDWTYVYQRQSASSTAYLDNVVAAPVKNIVNGFKIINKQPFNEVFGLKTSFNYRLDQNIVESIDQYTLEYGNTNDHWLGMNIELIFDNSRERDLNIWHGTKGKIWVEGMFEPSEAASDFVNIGIDFRNALDIHRNMTWAFRLAGNTNFGNRRMVYYMGGVDEWIRFQQSSPYFNDDQSIAQDQNYYFQTVATPMRGFLQNDRNGNSFAMINNEIRMPIFKMFRQKPIKSDFIRHFQLTLLSDMGLAWTGLNPWEDENFKIREVNVGGDSGGDQLTIKINNTIDPLIGSFGWGVRSKVLGYFIKFDYAWGVQDGVVQEPIKYLSMSLDF